MSTTDFTTSLPGNFYAVGIGPGSPDMITLRAQAIIKSADVIVAPQSKLAKTSMALEVVAPLIQNQQVESCIYPMNRDEKSTLQFWQEVAQQVARWCAKKLSVVQITIGDPLIFSTSCYLLNALEDLIPASNVHVVPGISAFQAASAIFQEALTMQEDRLMLMTATDMERVGKALDECETLILYKAGRRIDELCELLEQKGLSQNTRLVCYAENTTRQYTTRTIKDAVGGQHGYMATVIIHLNRATWNDISGQRSRRGR